LPVGNIDRRDTRCAGARIIWGWRSVSRRVGRLVERPTLATA